MRWLARPVPKPVLAALGALVVLAVITVVVSGRAAGMRVVHAQAAWAPGGAAVELGGGRAELLVEGMPAPPAGDLYYVWVRHGAGALEPTGVRFTVNAMGEAGVEIPGRLRSGDAIAVSAAPARARGRQTPSALLVVAQL